MNIKLLISVFVSISLMIGNICSAQIDCLDHDKKELSSNIDTLTSILHCLKLANNKQQEINSKNLEIFIEDYLIRRSTLGNDDAVLLSNIFTHLSLSKSNLGEIESKEFMFKSYDLLRNYFPIENFEQFDSIANTLTDPTKDINYEVKKIKEFQIVDLEGLSVKQIRSVLFNYYKYFLSIKEISLAQVIFYEYESWGNQLVVFETNKKIGQLQESYETQKKQLLESQAATERIQKLTNSILFISILGILFFCLMSYFVFRNKEAKAMDETRKIELQQKLLTKQMNPHFIFNAITAIHTQILIGQNKLAINYLNKFLNLINQIFQSTTLKFVSLESELNTLNEYITLQQLRFYDTFDYNVTIDKNIDKNKIFIPPMIIQPFIENAIEHGIRDIKYKALIELNISLKIIYFNVKF